VARENNRRTGSVSRNTALPDLDTDFSKFSVWLFQLFHNGSDGERRGHVFATGTAARGVKQYVARKARSAGPLHSLYNLDLNAGSASGDVGAVTS
jgi:hypothetical protein